MGGLKCLQCVGDHKAFVLRRDNGLTGISDAEPVIEDAITFAPMWQTMAQGVTVALGVVAVPVYYAHLAAKPLSAEELAVRGGRLLPVRLAPDGRS